MPDYCFTSYLRRAIHTLDIVLDNIDRCWLPVVKDWHLNERHYGALQGLNKTDTARRVGQEQVHIWRRSYDVAPPALTHDDPRFPGNDPAYKDLAADELPLTESLADTVRRVEICREELIVPALRHYGTVLIAAHGNSLRALAMKLLNLSPQEIVSVEIPTGSLWMFTLDDYLRVTANRYI